ncbi:MAG: peptidylprolyl isomerase [Planctomycetota bacterium]|jgi:foldase protein PrsA
MNLLKALVPALLFMSLSPLLTGCTLFPSLEEDPPAKNAESQRADRQERTEAGGGGKKADLSDAAGREAMAARSAIPPEPKGEGGNASSESYGPEYMEEEPKGDLVLARVDDKEIHASDLYQVYLLDNPIKVRRVLQDLVLYEVVKKEAVRLGVRVGKDPVEASLNAMIQDQQGRIAMSIDEDLRLEEFVKSQYGLEMPQYRDMIRQASVFQALLERCVRYCEFKVRRVEVGVILLRDRESADQIHKKLKKGASFEVLARENSVNPTSAMGGILPPFPADMDYPMIKDSIALGIGEISEVKETSVGKEKLFRIIKLIDILEPVQGSYQELEARIEESLKTQPMVIPDIVDYWLLKLKDRYAIDFYLH